MPDRDTRQAVASWLLQEQQRDPALAELLAPKVAELFGPEPKRITSEHWALLTKDSNEPPKANPDPQA